MKKTLLLAILAALGAPGCYLDLGGDPPPNPRSSVADGGVDAARWDGGDWDSGPWNPDASSWNPGENSLAVEGVVLSGQLGEVSSDQDAEFYVYESFGNTDYATIDIRSRNASGVLMNQVTIANSQLLQVGETYESNNSTNGASLFVSVIGCSGPDNGVWRTDTGSEEVTLDVREGPEEGSAELFYTATFATGEVVSGSFVMPLAEEVTQIPPPRR